MAYIYKKKSFKMTSLNITYNLGALFEQEGEYGTSHLMEHLICKTFKDEYALLTKLDVTWNAYTTSEGIRVYFVGLDKYFTPEIKERLVSKLLGGLNISEEEFEAEKNVVLQEYMDSFNDPTSSLNILREKFNFYGPIGKRSDIEKFSYKDMKAKYKQFFTKPAKIVEIGPSQSNFSKVKFAEDYIVQPRKLKWKKAYKGVEFEQLPVNNKCDVEFIGKKMIKKADYPAMIVAIEMLAGGLESPMYQEIREKAHLTYGVGHGTLKLLQDTLYSFDAVTDLENKDKLIAEFNKFWTDIKSWLTKERFDDVISSYYISDEKTKLFAYANVNEYLRKGLPRVGNSYKKLTFEKVVEVAEKYLNTDSFDLVVH